MSRHFKTIFILFTICTVGAMLWASASLLTRGQAQSSVRDETDPYTDIDDKASRAAGGDENAIRELADAVFRGLSIGEMPEQVVRPYRERVIRSEINFRGGRREGVAEANIVRVIDELAARFDAPEYARTDTNEVRMMRLSVSHMMPRFVPRQALQGRSVADEMAGFSVAPRMSPLEAVYVTAMLLEQKRHNEYFLLTREERAEIEAALQRLQDDPGLNQEERAGVRIALIEQRIYTDRPRLTPEEIVTRVKQHSREQGTLRTEARLGARPSTPRQEEMRAVVRRAGSMNISDALDLTHRLLDALDIER